ncbi:MAG: phosphodiester glycosidase family protein [Leptospirales bacterium]|nr:phosphodiester glycosidase family protein [Leptospirales bacterium]
MAVEVSYPLLLVALATLLVLSALWLRRRLPRTGAALAALLAAFLLPIVAAALLRLAMLARPQPEDLSLELHPGLRYLRKSLQAPRRMVVHTLIIDLRQPDLHFAISRPTLSAGSEYRAQTVQEYAEERGLFAAMNGDFFLPWHYRRPWDYYPHRGEPVSPNGPVLSEGIEYPIRVRPPVSTAYFTRENRISFDRRPIAAWNAISGQPLLLKDGQLSVHLQGESPVYYDRPHPRSAIGIDASGARMIWMVIDGRQPGYSMGARILDLVALMREQGAVTVMNLDGGGSSTLVARNATGELQALNAPIHHNLPGPQRPVANALGLYFGSERGR